MPNSEYDNVHFFEEYAKMFRSQQGLSGAGEWRQLRLLFPDVAWKSVLDAGCGYGWRCTMWQISIGCSQTWQER